MFRFNSIHLWMFRGNHLWKTDQINVKGWPCGCGITIHTSNVNGLLPAPHGANYTYSMPPGGMWGGIIGTSNNGYITAFQWLSSQVRFESKYL